MVVVVEVTMTRCGGGENDGDVVAVEAEMTVMCWQWG